MAAFNYTGWALIVWAEPKEYTRQFIDFAADTGTLRVWPEDACIQEHEYLGQMKDHPALEIRFAHGNDY